MKLSKLFPFFLFLPGCLFAQLPDDWFHLDPIDDGYMGISAYKAYEILKGKESETVVVAIIDNGAEITHEDLKENIWVNEDEIPDNQIDDDRNGYIDDIHGWNFLGNPDGKSLKYENIELTRYFKFLNEKYEGKSEQEIPKDQRKEYRMYKEIKLKFELKVKEEQESLHLYSNIITNYDEADKILRNYLKDSVFTKDELMQIDSKDELLLWARDFMLWAKVNSINLDMAVSQYNSIKDKLDKRLNVDFNEREEIIGDDPGNIKDTLYGNNNVAARGPYHGTGVAGIVGAVNNELGVLGIARNVKLMIIRIVPNGDERDKDVALAIRYAVRNGADIINCSFAKDYMIYPEFIYNAMKEAEERDVLIVHAAGNDSRNTDKEPVFPNGFYADERTASNWINVGSSNTTDNGGLVSYFSNYGKKSVDIFAPGFQIKTTVLNNKYAFTSGTSSASPVVAGIAAVLKSYYPHLSAPQIKEIILESAYVPKTKKVIIPGMEKKTIKFKKISKAGGIANLHGAIQLAEVSLR